LEEIKDIAPADLVYSDETGIDDNEVSRKGWASRGERCQATKKAERKTRYNITAAYSVNQLFAPFVFEGYSTAGIYETYIEHVLVPSLRPGQVLIIDNASFHKSKKIEQLILNAGCRIIFLPPYSPDFNPIEHCWATVKNEIRKAATTIDDFYKATVETLGKMCAA